MGGDLVAYVNKGAQTLVLTGRFFIGLTIGQKSDMCAARHFYRKVLARRKIVIVEIAIMVIDITQISAVYKKKRGSPIKIQL